MSTTFRFYDATTGEIARAKFVGSPRQVAINTPAGLHPIAGDADPSSQRVQLVTDDYGEAVPVLVGEAAVQPAPAQPEADELRTWVLDASISRYVPVPTFRGLQRQRQSQLEAEMDAVDALRVRPLAESARGALSEAGRQKLDDTEAQLVVLRAKWQSIEAATTQAELDAIT